jgi:hypothetical protein
MPVRYDPSAQTLSIGSLQIEIGNAFIWNPRPQWDHLRDFPADFLTTSQTGIRPLPAGLDEPLERLLHGITTNDHPMSYAGAYWLAGCGSGLTPTGDDVLMGVLYGLWVWHPQQKWMELILEAASPRTTSLSAAFLRAAAAGEATVHWHDLANGDSTAVERILAVGHRSGQEAWAGFSRTRTVLAN